MSFVSPFFNVSACVVMGSPLALVMDESAVK